MKYLVDSYWVIDALVGIPSAIGPLRRLVNESVAISILMFGELYEGTNGGQNPQSEIARIPVITIYQP